MHHNPLLEKAIQYLYGKGIITKDKDVADKMGYNKTTVSAYIKGKSKSSPKFNKEFENTFNIKLSDFAPGGKEETIKKPDAIQLLAESILQIKAEIQTNRTMMIEVLSKVKDRPVMEIQLMAEKLLEHNLSKILNELKQG
jgi:transcriptional regulator with XRE-family HTH domain